VVSERASRARAGVPDEAPLWPRPAPQGRPEGAGRWCCPVWAVSPRVEGRVARGLSARGVAPRLRLLFSYACPPSHRARYPRSVCPSASSLSSPCYTICCSPSDSLCPRHCRLDIHVSLHARYPSIPLLDRTVLAYLRIMLIYSACCTCLDVEPLS
jgi:hypothetical protein